MVRSERLKWMAFGLVAGPAAFLLTGQQSCEPACPDGDGDEVCDEDDICPAGDDYVDNDGDGVPDACEVPDGNGELLLTDGSAGIIYHTDLQGNVLNRFKSPVTGLTGVTFDKRKQDGFWVIGNGDPDAFYKVDWSGNTVQILPVNGYSLNPVYGLDYSVGADPSQDRLVEVGINVNNINVIQGALVSSGTRDFESSYYNNGFLTGYWGVDMTGTDFGYGFSGWWSTRTSHDVAEFWELTTHYETMPVVDAPYGIAVEPDESAFYIVGGDGLVHTFMNDMEVSSFGIEGAHLLDISLNR